MTRSQAQRNYWVKHHAEIDAQNERNNAASAHRDSQRASQFQRDVITRLAAQTNEVIVFSDSLTQGDASAIVDRLNDKIAHI